MFAVPDSTGGHRVRRGAMARCDQLGGSAVKVTTVAQTMFTTSRTDGLATSTDRHFQAPSKAASAACSRRGGPRASTRPQQSFNLAGSEREADFGASDIVGAKAQEGPPGPGAGTTGAPGVREEKGRGGRGRSPEEDQEDRRYPPCQSANKAAAFERSGVQPRERVPRPAQHRRRGSAGNDGGPGWNAAAAGQAFNGEGRSKTRVIDDRGRPQGRGRRRNAGRD